jgi:hypothetical protein
MLLLGRGRVFLEALLEGAGLGVLRGVSHVYVLSVDPHVCSVRRLCCHGGMTFQGRHRHPLRRLAWRESEA